MKILKCELRQSLLWQTFEWTRNGGIQRNHLIWRFHFAAREETEINFKDKNLKDKNLKDKNLKDKKLYGKDIVIL